MTSTKRAIISVYHKDGIIDFAKDLLSLDFEIVSSGGTARALSEAGITVTDIAEISGLPSMLDGRVKTLVPHIHAGILAKETKEHQAELEKHNFPKFDLVCVDFYPLQSEIARDGSTQESVIELFDIGGPTMIRGAAKAGKIVIIDPNDRMRVVDWLKDGKPDEEVFLQELRAKAVYTTATYDLAAARYFSDGQMDGMIGKQFAECAYGENRWQAPAHVFKTESDDPLALSAFEHIAGTAPSANNWFDVDRLLQSITHVAAGFDLNTDSVPAIAIGVKHGNACGAGVGTTSQKALEKMLQGDLLAIFGGVIMCNFPITEPEAETLRSFKMDTGKRLLDAVIAPSFTEDAIDILARKGGKCRLLTNPALEKLSKDSLDQTARVRPVRGGFVRQPNYTKILNLKDADITGSEALPNDLILGWAIGSTSNSNTITLVKDGMLVGNAVGQQSRVGAAKLALMRAQDAGHDVSGSLAYSDSFFPFPDAPGVLINAGIRTILSTSGSVNDDQTRDLCKEKKVNLYLVPDADYRGFFGH